MKILLKDPAKVDAVIAKITDKYPGEHKMFEKYAIPSLKERVSEDDPAMLDVDYEWDGQRISVKFCYTMINDIPTDTEFLNDKEW